MSPATRPPRRPKRYRKARQRGLTLVEVLVAVGVIALIGVLIYSVFYGMSRTRKRMNTVADIYHQGRGALSRMAREISAAFISKHQPFVTTHEPRETVFIGSDERPADRLDFTSFSHRRLTADSHESDQNELSYFAAEDRENDKLDLVRREAKYIDEEPEKGGVILVLAEDIDSFDIRYLDPLTGEWLEDWDSTQPAAQLDRLPSQVWITLVINGGPGGTTVFETKIPVPIQLPLTFATGP